MTNPFIESEKPKNWLSKVQEAITDVKLILVTLAALGIGGGTMRVLGDAGVTEKRSKEIADSTAKAQIMPLDQKVDNFLSIMRKAFPQVEQAAREKAQADSADKKFTESLGGR